MKSYTSILAQILRLRQSCCHPTLIRRKEIVEDELEAEAAYDAAKGFSDDMDLHALIDRFSDQDETNANTYGAEILKQIRDEVEHECPICLSVPMKDMTVTGCYHAACKECWTDVIEVFINGKLDLSGLVTNPSIERERERGIAEMCHLSRTDK